MLEQRTVGELARLVGGLKRWHAHVRRLKRENFNATEVLDATPDAPQERGPRGRSADGRDTVRSCPRMGMAGARFSRNVPLAASEPESSERLSHPDPRLISRSLLVRPKGGFEPADQVNMLAAAWIQFQVHDWFGHVVDDLQPMHELNGSGPDPCAALAPLAIKRTRVDTTRPAAPGAREAYANELTHWWDGSQLYGSSEARAEALREQTRIDGVTIRRAELALVRDGRHGDILLPVDPSSGVEQTGFADNWWVGVSMLHTLFAREHNAVCAELRANEPDLMEPDAGSGRESACERQRRENRIFDHARLVTTALMAKIHTVEWTPAMLEDPVIHAALYADWLGFSDERLLAAADLLIEYASAFEDGTLADVVRELSSPTRDDTRKLLFDLASHLSPDDVPDRERAEQFLAGVVSIIEGRAPERIAGADAEILPDDLRAEHGEDGGQGSQGGFSQGAVYAMTEEFTAVYRMHPLLPDAQPILEIGESTAGPGNGRKVKLKHLLDGGARAKIMEHGLATLFNSFGRTHPGQLVLDNYPRALTKLENPVTRKRTRNGQPVDIAAVDILRDRERGIPRYTRFRQHVRGDRVVTFEDLTGASAPGISPEEREKRQVRARRLAEVYDEVDDVDVMVGLFAEAPRKGFAFSETAFYVFALMAPLRLRCDPFFTTLFTDEHYTRTGMRWIRDNTMTTILSRHLGGELRGALADVGNAFQPWGRHADRDADRDAVTAWEGY